MSTEAWSVDDHLAAGTPESVALWRDLERVINGFGPVSLSVSKSTVTFKGTRRGFAGAHPRGGVVMGYFDIMRSLGTDDPRINNASPYGRNLFVHHFRLTSADELDAAFTEWLREAYAVGCGAHLTRSGS